MLDSVRNYVYQRRKGIATTVGFFGGAYLASRYIVERLEEIREQVVQEKTASENLRQRFQQNQRDCTYTILALVPTMGDRILEEMDVESITLTLQRQSKVARAKAAGSTAFSEMNTSSLSLNTELPSVTSSLDLTTPGHGKEQEIREAKPQSSTVAQRWVEQFVQKPSEPETMDGDHTTRHEAGSPASSNAQLSDSVTSAGTSLISVSDGERSGVMVESSHSVLSESGESHAGVETEDRVMTTQSKAELWRELKILTFSRTLTILYSTTLLSLLTHIQLSLLGRYKYVQSVLEMEREEKQRDRQRDRQQFDANISRLFWGGGGLEGLFDNSNGDNTSHPFGRLGVDTEPIERKYLTLSWWLIHVGWREIGDRVRKAVEDVFEGVSLKTKLGTEDLEWLLTDVRHRIEFDNDTQGSPAADDGTPGRTEDSRRRISFLSSLIPPTSEGLRSVLVQGGLPAHLTSLDDALFIELIDETRACVSSADFGRVLEVCLDNATNLLFEGLRRTLFDCLTPDETTPGVPKLRLAGLLPGVARWSHTAIHGTPNELVEGLADIREVAGFSAIIFASYEASLR